MHCLEGGVKWKAAWPYTICKLRKFCFWHLTASTRINIFSHCYARMMEPNSITNLISLALCYVYVACVHTIIRTMKCVYSLNGGTHINNSHPPTERCSQKCKKTCSVFIFYHPYSLLISTHN